MSIITLSITTDNAAFDTDPGAEVARILRELAHRIEHADAEALDDYGSILRDSNGNTVGECYGNPSPSR